MKLIRLLLTAIMIAVGITACQKEIVEENIITTPPSTLSDSNYLDKIYFIDSVNGIKDTFQYYKYQYDNTKRVTNLTGYYVWNNVFEKLEEHEYYYIGSDTLPYKSISLYFEFANEYSNPAIIDTTITFHFYNNLGKKLKDSVLNVEHYTLGGPVYFKSWKEINQYQYTSNAIYNLNTNTTLNSNQPFSTDPQIFLDTALLDVKGNIVSYKRNFINNNISMPERIGSFTYDDKPSPFEKLSNFRALSVFPTGETFIEIMQSVNNRLKVYEENVYLGSVTFEEDLTGKYSYNANGFPRIIIQEEPSGSGTFFLSSFVYKAL